MLTLQRGPDERGVSGAAWLQRYSRGSSRRPQPRQSRFRGSGSRAGSAWVLELSRGKVAPEPDGRHLRGWFGKRQTRPERTACYRRDDRTISNGIPSVTVQARDCASVSDNDSEIIEGCSLFGVRLVWEGACISCVRERHQRAIWDRSRAQTDRWLDASTERISGGSNSSLYVPGMSLSSIGLAGRSSGEPDLVRAIGGVVLR